MGYKAINVVRILSRKGLLNVQIEICGIMLEHVLFSQLSYPKVPLSRACLGSESRYDIGSAPDTPCRQSREVMLTEI